MLSQVVRPKALIVIAGAFLALVGLHLWQQGSEQQADEVAEPSLQSSSIQVRRGENFVEIQPESLPTSSDVARMLEDRLQKLNSTGTDAANQRRATAIQLAHTVEDPIGRDMLRGLGAKKRQELESALLKGLGDPDQVIAANCADALLGLWRIPDSQAAAKMVATGVRAYDGGRLQEALSAFKTVARIDGSAPPDVHRLIAEIYLALGRPGDALDSCREAIRAERNHFAAFYTLARTYLAQKESAKALTALKGALRIYPRYSKALRLAEQLELPSGE